MIDENIQVELLKHYYDLWLDNPFNPLKMLKEINGTFENPLDKKTLEVNAQYLIQKHLLEPRMTAGFHTQITIPGVLFIESVQYSPDVKIRGEILKRIYEKYQTEIEDYVNIHEIKEEMGISTVKMYRNLLVLEYLGAVKLRKVLGGIKRAFITAQGIDSLNQPTVIEYESKVMSSAYSMLYKLENTLREYLEETLRDEYGDAWWEDGISNSVKPKALSNKKKDGGNLSNIYYTNFVHLKNIIQYDKN